MVIIYIYLSDFVKTCLLYFCLELDIAQLQASCCQKNCHCQAAPFKCKVCAALERAFPLVWPRLDQSGHC